MGKLSDTTQIPFEKVTNFLPGQLEMLSQEILMGYQIIDAYQCAVTQQFQLLGKREEFSTKWEGALFFYQEFYHNSNCAEAWSVAKFHIKRVYEQVIEPLLLSYETASENFAELVQSFEEFDASAKEMFLHSLKNLKANTAIAVAETKKLKDITNYFREYLELRIRKNQEYINKQLDGNTQKSKIKSILQSIESTQNSISEVNQSFLSKAYHEKISRNFVVDGIFVSKELVNTLVMATTHEEHFKLPSSLLEDRQSLMDNYGRLQGETDQLAGINRELSYFTLACHEFSKFNKNALHAIKANNDLADAWSTVQSNLGTLIERLEKLVSLSEENKTTILNMHIFRLRGTIEKLKGDIAQFKKNNLLPIRVTKALKNF